MPEVTTTSFITSRELGRRYIVTTVLNVFGLTLLYLVWPAVRLALVTEDQFLESATALLLLAAGFWGVVFIWRRQQRRWWWYVLSLLAFVAFLDEISFGLYWFNRDVPRVQGVTVDGVHDVVDVVFRLFNGRISTELIIIAAFLGGYGVMAGANWLSAAWWRAHASLQFLTIASLFFMMAMIIDLETIRHQFLFFIEELFEFNTAVALFFACVAMGAVDD